MVKHLAHTLQDSFEYEGLWWVPESPEKKVPGKLNFDPVKGTRLSLLGALSELPTSIGVGDRGFHCDSINGITANGVQCTLIDNYEAGWKIGFPGMRTQEFVSNLLLLGVYLTRDSLQFSKCLVNFDHLEEWITPRPFKFDIIQDNNQSTGYSVTLMAHTFFKEFIEVGSFNLSVSNNISGPNSDSTRMTLTNEAFVKIDPTNPLEFDEFRRIITDIGRLITLLIGDNTWPRKLHLTLTMMDETKNEYVPVTLSAFYRLSIFPTTRRLYRHNMTVGFETFVEHLPDIVNRWLGSGIGIQAVKHLFLAALYNENINLENRFLNLVHALESYHRAAIGGKYINQHTYDLNRVDIEKAIPQDFPTDLRDALRSRLKYGNEFSLRKRLTELLGSIEKQLLDLVIDAVTVQRFIGRIVDTRNYYVHYDEALKSQAMDIHEIYVTHSRLALLVRIFLLRELGFNDNQIYQMLHDKFTLPPLD